MTYRVYIAFLIGLIVGGMLMAATLALGLTHIWYKP